MNLAVSSIAGGSKTSVWKCKRCGFSRVMSLSMKWDSNGTIPMFAKVLKYRPGKTCDMKEKA